MSKKPKTLYVVGYIDTNNNYDLYTTNIFKSLSETKEYINLKNSSYNPECRWVIAELTPKFVEKPVRQKIQWANAESR